MATYVSSPPTQSGVADSRTSITRAFTFFAGGSVQIDYEVSSEEGFDFFRVFISNLVTPVFTDSGVGAGRVTETINTASGGSLDLRLEYLKDGGVDDGNDNVVIHEIRIYNSSAVLQETYTFSGTNGAGPPTGWTERLTDGTTVSGSNWTLTDTGGGGTTLTPSLFTNSQTFHGPTLTQALAPSLFTNSQTFYGPTLRQTLAPSLLANSQSFFSPALSQTLAAGLFTSSQTFYGPTVAVGGDTLLPSLFANAQTFYGPALGLTLGGAWWVNHPQFFSATLAVSTPPVLPSAAGVSLRRSGTPSVRQGGASSSPSASVGSSRPASAGVRKASFLSVRLKG